MGGILVARLSPTGNLIPGCGCAGDLAGSLVNEHIRSAAAARAAKFGTASARSPLPAFVPRTPNVALVSENSGQPLCVRGSFSMAAFHS